MLDSEVLTLHQSVLFVQKLVDCHNESSAGSLAGPEVRHCVVNLSQFTELSRPSLDFHYLYARGLTLELRVQSLAEVGQEMVRSDESDSPFEGVEQIHLHSLDLFELELFMANALCHLSHE